MNVITFHDGGTPEPELPGAVNRKRLAGFRIDDHSLGGRRQEPRRAVPSTLLQGVGGGPNAGGFRQTITLKDGDVGILGHKALYDLLAQRSPTGEHRMQRRDIVLALDSGGVVEHGHQNGRHEREVSGAEPLDRGEHVVHLELGEHDDGGAGSQKPRGEGDQAVYVKHGDRAYEGFVLLHVEPTQHDLDHCYEVAVGRYHALAGPRGAGGVEQRGRVVLLHALFHALSHRFLLRHLIKSGHDIIIVIVIIGAVVVHENDW